MKYLFLLLCLTSTAFATEIENNVNSCDVVVSKISSKYRELSEISSRMMVLNHEGTESYSVPSRESEDCETVVSEFQVLLRQRERVEQELVTLKRERERDCPRVYPE